MKHIGFKNVSRQPSRRSFQCARVLPPLHVRTLCVFSGYYLPIFPFAWFFRMQLPLTNQIRTLFMRYLPLAVPSFPDADANESPHAPHGVVLSWRLPASCCLWQTPPLQAPLRGFRPNLPFSRIFSNFQFFVKVVVFLPFTLIFPRP